MGNFRDILVDLTETPIERITPTGIKTSAREYDFDIIIYATGFDVITGASTVSTFGASTTFR